MLTWISCIMSQNSGQTRAGTQPHLPSDSPPPMPPSLPGLPARTCAGTLPCWESMWQYLIKFTKVQVDITFIISKLIDAVPSHAKGT